VNGSDPTDALGLPMLIGDGGARAYSQSLLA